MKILIYCVSSQVEKLFEHGAEFLFICLKDFFPRGQGRPKDGKFDELFFQKLMHPSFNFDPDEASEADIDQVVEWIAQWYTRGRPQ